MYKKKTIEIRKVINNKINEMIILNNENDENDL